MTSQSMSGDRRVSPTAGTGPYGTLRPKVGSAKLEVGIGRLWCPLFLHQGTELLPTHLVCCLGRAGDPINRPLADSKRPEPCAVVALNDNVYVSESDRDLLIESQRELCHLRRMAATTRHVELC